MSAAKKLPAIGYSEETAPRIRAYLASVRPMRGVVEGEEGEDAYHRGRSAIERLALSATGTDRPRLLFTRKQCADVLHFMRLSEPFAEGEATWWQDPKDAPSHLVGYYFVLGALEESLREARP